VPVLCNLFASRFWLAFNWHSIVGQIHNPHAIFYAFILGYVVVEWAETNQILHAIGAAFSPGHNVMHR